MGLESALSELEVQLDRVAVAAKKAQSALKKAQACAKSGQLRDLQNQLAEARNAAKRFAEETESADQAWAFEAEPYFSNGDYVKELIAEAETAGLAVYERDNRLYCPPMLLTVSARDAAVYINRKIERRIRPAALVRLLAARQKKPQRVNAQRLLDTLFQGYRVLAPQSRTDWRADLAGPGPVVPLTDIYELFTILPGVDRDYSRDEFARDIYLLDEQPDLQTKDGRRFALPASTSTKTGGKRLTVIDREGAERVYVGIRFDRD